MRGPGKRAHDAAFNHAMAGGRVRDESRRNGHFEDDLFIFGYAFDGDQRSAGAYINGGAEFKDGTALGVGSVYKNGKGNWQPWPASSPVFGFAHVIIVLYRSRKFEITLVAFANEQVH